MTSLAEKICFSLTMFGKEIAHVQRESSLCLSLDRCLYPCPLCEEIKHEDDAAVVAAPTAAPASDAPAASACAVPVAALVASPANVVTCLPSVAVTSLPSCCSFSSLSACAGVSVASPATAITPVAPAFAKKIANAKGKACDASCCFICAPAVSAPVAFVPAVSAPVPVTNSIGARGPKAPAIISGVFYHFKVPKSKAPSVPSRRAVVAAPLGAVVATPAARPTAPVRPSRAVVAARPAAASPTAAVAGPTAAAVPAVRPVCAPLASATLSPAKTTKAKARRIRRARLAHIRAIAKSRAPKKLQCVAHHNVKAADARSPLSLLSQNKFFPLVVAECTHEFWEEMVCSQIQAINSAIVQPCRELHDKKRKAKHAKKGKRAQTIKLRSSAQVASPTSVFKHGCLNIPVPKFSGACVRQYLEHKGMVSAEQTFISGDGLGKLALHHGWNLWFGKIAVASIGSWQLYHSHIAAEKAPGLTRLTIKSFEDYKSMLVKWGEPQMPSKAPGQTKDKPKKKSANAPQVPRAPTNPPPEAPQDVHGTVTHSEKAPATGRNKMANVLPVSRDAQLEDYYKIPPNASLPYERLATDQIYRLVHSDGVAKMKKELMENGFDWQHPLIVRRFQPIDDDPNNESRFVIVDGMHRIMAMQEIQQELGIDTFHRLLGSTEGFPCLLVRHDTPEYVLVGFASKSNASNTHYTPMSWMDSILNIAKFAMSFAEHEEKIGGESKAIWVCLKHEKIYKALSLSLSYSDFQKKMGVATVLSSSRC